jgi:hypothetical protein
MDLIIRVKYVECEWMNENDCLASNKNHIAQFQQHKEETNKKMELTIKKRKLLARWNDDDDDCVGWEVSFRFKLIDIRASSPPSPSSFFQFSSLVFFDIRCRLRENSKIFYWAENHRIFALSIFYLLFLVVTIAMHYATIQ